MKTEIEELHELMCNTNISIEELRHTIGKVQRDIQELRSDFNEPWAKTSPHVRWQHLHDAIDALRTDCGMTPDTILGDVARHLCAQEGK